MDAIQPQDLQQIVAEGEIVMPCTAPDPSLEAKAESKTVDAAPTEASEAPVEPTIAAVTENAKPSDEPAIEADAAVETAQEEKQQPADETAPVAEPEKQEPAATVSEEIRSTESDSLEEVAIIKQKRKFDAIQDEESAAEENVAKKIKFEE